MDAKNNNSNDKWVKAEADIDEKMHVTNEDGIRQ